tara:strand:- start:59 stop:430 length:372 start_codon:yes stop_codon:yes gene_type:complete
VLEHELDDSDIDLGVLPLLLTPALRRGGQRRTFCLGVVELELEVSLSFEPTMTLTLGVVRGVALRLLVPTLLGESAVGRNGLELALDAKLRLPELFARERVVPEGLVSDLLRGCFNGILVKLE